MRCDIERALKEEMQQKIQKQITELHASLKMELLEAIQKDITSLVRRSKLVRITLPLCYVMEIKISEDNITPLLCHGDQN